MPSLALVTQAGAPNSSATATLVETFTAVATGTSDNSQILQVQALPKLYFWIDVTAGGPLTIQPQFAVRGNTDQPQPKIYDPLPEWKNLGPAVVHPGAGAGPFIYQYEFPAVWIRFQYTTGGPNPSTWESILAASV